MVFFETFSKDGETENDTNEKENLLDNKPIVPSSIEISHKDDCNILIVDLDANNSNKKDKVKNERSLNTNSANLLQNDNSIIDSEFNKRIIETESSSIQNNTSNNYKNKGVEKGSCNDRIVNKDGTRRLLPEARGFYYDMIDNKKHNLPPILSEQIKKRMDELDRINESRNLYRMEPKSGERLIETRRIKKKSVRKFEDYYFNIEDYNETMLFCRRKIEKMAGPNFLIKGMTYTLKCCLCDNQKLTEIEKYPIKNINRIIFNIIDLILNDIELTFDLFDKEKIADNYKDLAHVLTIKGCYISPFSYNTQTNTAILKYYMEKKVNGLLPFLLAKKILKLIKKFGAFFGDHKFKVRMYFPFLLDIESRNLLVSIVRVMKGLLDFKTRNNLDMKTICEYFAPMVFPKCLFKNKKDKNAIVKFMELMMAYNYDFPYSGLVKEMATIKANKKQNLS